MGLKKVRPSVSKEGLRDFEKWNNEFGSKMRPSAKAVRDDFRIAETLPGFYTRSWVCRLLLFSLVVVAVAVQISRTGVHIDWKFPIASDSSVEKVGDSLPSVLGSPTSFESPLRPILAAPSPHNAVSLPVDKAQEMVQVNMKPTVTSSSNDQRSETFVKTSFGGYIRLGLSHVTVLFLLLMYLATICHGIAWYFGGPLRGKFQPCLRPIVVAVSVALVAMAKDRSSGTVAVHFWGSVLFGIGWLWLFRQTTETANDLTKFLSVTLLVLPLYSELLLL